NFTLEAGQEIERLYTTNDAGTAALRLTGNEFVNALKGNAGSNALNGGGGADVMTGLGGNDTYYVDGAGDRAIEAAGGGTDTVLTSVDYTLETGQEIERLYTTSDAATGELKLTGNEFVNALKGNAGSNTLNGGGGADTMTGLGGADTFYVNVAGDRVIEAAGGGTDVVLTSVDYALESAQEIERLHTISDAGTEALKLTGNEFANAIRGNAGANVLDGGRGSDTLFGLGGKDVFVFSTAVANNIDNIADFLVVDDSIQLSRSIFGALQIGALDQNAFKDIGITGASFDASDRILYNRQTGALFYDADGSLTGSAAIQFAALDNKALITYADFTVV
uniref:calcium-binding protein n=1 Tax=Methylopila sp. Yamaguchi TaxID=1437817 RepID=UPI00190E97B8